jgi:hypothetical protein
MALMQGGYIGQGVRGGAGAAPRAALAPRPPSFSPPFALGQRRRGPLDESDLE